MTLNGKEVIMIRKLTVTMLLKKGKMTVMMVLGKVIMRVMDDVLLFRK